MSSLQNIDNEKTFKKNSNFQTSSGNGCSLTPLQALGITIPILLICLFFTLFFPIYYKNKTKKTE